MLKRIESYIGLLDPHVSLILGIALTIAVLLLALVTRVSRARKTRLELIERIHRLIQPEAGLENNLNLFLEVVSSLVDAYGYAFYVRNGMSGTFMLKAVRHRRQEPGQVAPSYSGLAPYAKEVYQAPISMSAEAGAQPAGIIREGEVPLLHLPVDGGHGVIRIGPVERVSRRQMEHLHLLTGLFARLLDVLMESDRLHMKADVVETSSMALHAVSSMAVNSEAVVQKTFSMSASALGMSGGCLLVAESGNVTVPVSFGWTEETWRKLSHPDNLSLVIRLIGSQETVLWQPGDDRYEQLLQCLGNRNDRLVYAGKLPLPDKQVWFVSGFPQTELSAEQLLTTLTLMTRQLSQLIRIQEGIRPLGQTFTEFLKLLSGTIDDLNPYTVGYSEMMSRYAILIAKEMGLPRQQVVNIGIAAHLSNIGVLGLSEDLYLKEGKFTEVEFEKMKLHAEVGASIVEMTIGSKEIADCIRYHHERVDGNGYPAGLKGEDIPVGARIIAVVQTFLAKINGRKYRDPLPFDKAMKLMRSLAGTQLDARAVEVFAGWFESKRKGLQVNGRALGVCWEMCCTPSDICRTCPAYTASEQNCWEVQGNHCLAHGKSCETCFVYTETQSRSVSL